MQYYQEEIKNHKETIIHLDNISIQLFKTYLAVLGGFFIYGSFVYKNHDTSSLLFPIMGIGITALVVLVGYIIMRGLSHIVKKRIMHVRQIKNLRQYIEEKFKDNDFSRYSVMPLTQSSVYLKHFDGISSYFTIINTIIAMTSYFYFHFISEKYALLCTIIFTVISFVLLVNVCYIHTREMLIADYSIDSLSEKKIRKIIGDNEDKSTKTPNYLIKLYFLSSIALFFYGLNLSFSIISFDIYIDIIMILAVSITIITRIVTLKKFIYTAENKLRKILHKRKKELLANPDLSS